MTSCLLCGLLVVRVRTSSVVNGSERWLLEEWFGLKEEDCKEDCSPDCSPDGSPYCSPDRSEIGGGGESSGRVSVMLVFVVVVVVVVVVFGVNDRVVGFDVLNVSSVISSVVSSVELLSPI